MEAFCAYDEINFPSLYVAKFEGHHFNLDQFKEDFQVNHLLEEFKNEQVEGLFFQNCMIQGLSGLPELFPNIRHIVFKDSSLENIEWKNLEIFNKIEIFKVENCVIELFMGTIFEWCSSMIFRIEGRQENVNLETEMTIIVPNRKVNPVEPAKIAQIQIPVIPTMQQKDDAASFQLLQFDPLNFTKVQQINVPEFIHVDKRETLQNVPEPSNDLVKKDGEDDLFVEDYIKLGAIKKINKIEPKKLEDFNFKMSGPTSLTLGPGNLNFLFPQRFEHQNQNENLTLSPSTLSDSSTASEKNMSNSLKSMKDSDNDKAWQLRCSKLESHIITLSNQLETNQLEIVKLNLMLDDLKKVFADDDFKDFTFKIKDSSFLVHKVLFAAKSSVFAKMIKNNPYAEEMNLVDIPVATFQIILDFIYNNRLPDNNDNLIEIFAASGRLNISELMNTTAKKLMDIIDERNALETLMLAHKYGNDELRQKAFKCIQEKIFPDRKLAEEFLRQPEKIKKLIEMKKRLDEEYEKMRLELEDFEIGEKEVKEELCEEKSVENISPSTISNSEDGFCVITDGASY
ncbi:hypothetical protein PVAND_017576 [Polypedilum vanderplanki]|uniref:BTB domain-containing protein n=1 Tax=Polypedilum vanderplanki TaxID=319348 RepID=A0A9J6BIQ0_POLVA|nr:hypothetical protein PVAND_017576 [Polypedilum vanderplanki]